ncbi:DUF4846 domain-containing protein [Kordiimonas lacus]|uniref:DUF4846 domain-containing protein n=1 Tax=Kordiimonas lacus TaxID=637679 RepID=A0A1G6TYQ3_9PROT|nr:DUF4846 domain-containing protein [Kordiimonas lacus]SDD33425.1 protein of unknown function (4846) [Kordiimonas lacus]
MTALRLLAFVGLVLLQASAAVAAPYPWLEDGGQATETLKARHPAPAGFERVAATPGSFAYFLRHLPMKPTGTPLRLYDGSKVAWPAYAGAIIDLDLGPRDLQQCADTLIRLYAEYHYAQGSAETLSFNFTSGDTFPYADYLSGRRPVVAGRKVLWQQEDARDHGRDAFRRWLDTIFLYAGTASLARDFPGVNLKEARIGDLFIGPGFPGHTVMIADMAVDGAGKRKILLIEGFSPAQDAHVLRNLLPFSDGDWYDLTNGEDLITPVWRFTPRQLHRME